ncbi:LysR substrate-binding domain-containing protein [Leisingera sp. ANG-M1]|uniref:LysR substrate-binding domain-containing protein n=1 Tax=Leisingera sp. ANG-M1 TaxID=1577895 RepID=UPI00068E528C|nr:LysR substrate-binding domain-containing protein [Leisingera sp. ANG-M1]
MVEKARETVESYDNLVPSILGKEALNGEFHLEVVPIALTGLMPRTLTILKENCPQLHLRISTGLTHQMLIELERGNIEGALITKPQALPPDIICQNIVTEEFEVLAAPAAASDDPVELLSSNTFIRFNRQAVAGQQIEAWLQTKGIRVAETMELLGLGAVSSMVAANLGVPICPKSCVPSPLSTGLKRISLGPDGPSRTLSLMRRSKSPKLHLIAQVQHALQAAASGQEL